MYYSAPSIVVAVVALAGYLLLTAWRARRDLSARGHVAALALLAGLALLAHSNLLRVEDDGGVEARAPIPHVHEIFHYYLGTKYFAEVGHTGLYDAAVIADFEDDREHFRVDGLMRNLASNELGVRRGEVLERSAGIKAPFTPERWREFKLDVERLRSHTRSEYWHTTGPYVDHGYNGTPLVTALLGGLANQTVVDPLVFLELMRWLDLYLVGLVAVVAAGLLSPRVGLTFLFFTYANLLNEYAFVGGAYLRYSYFVALALGVLALRSRRLALAGLLVAVSGWLRIFPLLLPVVLLAGQLLRPGGGPRVRRYARFYVSFAAGSLVLLGLTSGLATPDGRNPWRAFADNLSVHAGAPGSNRIGLVALFSYAPQHERRRAEAFRDGTFFDWEEATTRQLERRRIPLLASALLLLTVAGIALRRLRTHQLLLPWLLLVFCVQPLAHYYYAVLGVIPLAQSGDSRVLALLAGALVAVALVASPLLPSWQLDLRFALQSAVVLGFLLAGLALAARDARRT
jgi:hypothetical protein